MASPKADLRELLISLFSSEQARRFVQDEFGDEVANEVDWERPWAETARQLVDELERRGLAKQASSSPPAAATTCDTYDVFICHASEDKESVVEPLVAALEEAAVSHWYDAKEIAWGDSITGKIDDGLAKSRFVIVVVSNAFLAKNWPKKELQTALNREITQGNKTVLPVLVCDAGREQDLLQQLPLLSDKLSLRWTGEPSSIVAPLVATVASTPAAPDHPTRPLKSSLRQTILRRRRWLVLAGLATITLLVGLAFRIAQTSPNRHRLRGTMLVPLTAPARSASSFLTSDSPPPPGMALIAGATFEMGAPEDEIANVHQACSGRCDPIWLTREQRVGRQVTISPFFLDIHEITTTSWAHWLSDQPITMNRQVRHGAIYYEILDEHQRPLGWAGTGLGTIRTTDNTFRPERGSTRWPATFVTWYGAKRYCASRDKRLPTEAEWELAARGPEGNRRPWGAEPPDCDLATYGRADNVMGDRRQCNGDGPREVGTARDVNPNGVHDLGGNAREWVLDSFTEGPLPPGDYSDPIQNGSSTSRTVRGASWRSADFMVRGARRSYEDAAQTDETIGFRCAKSLDERTQ